MAERQTHTTQNRAGNHVGSNPTFGTNTSELYVRFFIVLLGVILQVLLALFEHIQTNPHSMFCTRDPVSQLTPEN